MESAAAVPSGASGLSGMAAGGSTSGGGLLAALASLDLAPLPDTSVEVCGFPTRIACVRYSNRVFLTVSQLPSFGSLVSLARPNYPVPIWPCSVTGWLQDDAKRLQLWPHFAPPPHAHCTRA